MNDLIKVEVGGEKPMVLGRDLHAALEVQTAYKDWFPRMCEYGFTEGTDFCSFLSESTGGRPSTDHQLTIDMAKELCMVLYGIVHTMARAYDEAVTPNLDDWLDTFDAFPIFEVFGELKPLLNASLQTTKK